MKKWFYQVIIVPSTGARDSNVYWKTEQEMALFFSEKRKQWEFEVWDILIFELNQDGQKKDVTKFINKEISKILKNKKSPYVCDSCLEPGNIDNCGFSCQSCGSGSIIHLA